MTNFKAYMRLLGLHDVTAAHFLGLKPKTVEKMKAGRTPVPSGIIDELSEAYTFLEKTAHQLVEKINHLSLANDRQKTFMLGITKHDDDARKLGWPCAETHMIMGGLVVHHSLHHVDIRERACVQDHNDRHKISENQCDLEELSVFYGKSSINDANHGV